MAGYTKKIVASGSQHSAGELLTHLSFRHHFLYLVSQGFLEKNQSIRVFMCDHLNTILTVHGSKKHQLESHDGLANIENCLKKGLTDPNPEARSKSRDAFFKFEMIWKENADRIYEGLETNIKKQVNTARTALEKNGNGSAASARTSSSTTAAPRRPGGPSAALMAAKRAASQKIAREKKEAEEEEEREREAAFEEINERQQKLNLNSTPTISSPPQAASTPTSTVRKPRPVSYISPRSTLREASTIPLPGSGSGRIHERTSSASGLPIRSRTSSSGSQSTTGSQSGTPRQAIPSSSRIQPRNTSGSSTPSNIPRARTTSSSSSTSARSGGASAKLSSGRRPPVAASAQANKAFQVRSPETGADDTLQFPAGDASMDLMAFTSPLKGKGSLLDQSMSDLTFQNDNSADETARFPTRQEEAEERSIAKEADEAKKAVSGIEDLLEEKKEARNGNEAGPTTPKMGSSNLPGSSNIKLNRSPNPQTSTPTSVQRRSGLPRPVSMLHRGPSPLHHYSNEPSSPPSSSSSTFSSRHAPTRSLDASNLLNSSATKQRNPSGSSDVSSMSHEGGNLPTLSASSMTLMADSSFGTVASQFNQSQSGPSKSNLWFLNRSSRLDSAEDATSSPIKSKPESKEWVDSLRNGSADLKVFRRLAKLSSEFKLPNISHAFGSGFDDASVLQPGRLNSNGKKSNGGGALGLQKMGEDEFTRDDEERAVDAWTEGNLFVRIFDGLTMFLDGKNQVS